MLKNRSCAFKMRPGRADRCPNCCTPTTSRYRRIAFGKATAAAGAEPTPALKKLETENIRQKRLVADQALDIVAQGAQSQTVEPASKRAALDHLRGIYQVSKIQACRLTALAVTTYRHRLHGCRTEQPLREALWRQAACIAGGPIRRRRKQQLSRGVGCSPSRPPVPLSGGAWTSSTTG